MGHALPRMSLPEFLEWEDSQVERHEFWRGEVFAMVGGNRRHHQVIQNLTFQLRTHLKGTNCAVFSESMKAQAPEGVLYPDVMVACGLGEAGDERSVTNPVLAIEVLSPGTSRYDRGDKSALYRTFDSLREYVMIHPVTREIEVFVWLEPGRWMLTDQTTNIALMLASVHCAIPMADVFEGVQADPA